MAAGGAISDAGDGVFELPAAAVKLGGCEAKLGLSKKLAALVSSIPVVGWASG